MEAQLSSAEVRAQRRSRSAAECGGGTVSGFVFCTRIWHLAGGTGGGPAFADTSLESGEPVAGRGCRSVQWRGRLRARDRAGDQISVRQAPGEPR
jgi:hypothetical protein